ncbi:zinc ribbon domain-containing protein [Clostridium polynesiense]|uniref:zinc ribbon domain-containing protein n=1 Tax=Clostridium polynesiense TaxID=1325933 RepID=UPI00058FE9DE|nr:zinc ribbon domain-containing protein [Clostridium polynesiense]
MFFIGIFGIESKQKEIGMLEDLGCKSCSRKSLKIIKVYNYFHFFFIPLFKWNKSYYAVCKTCGAIYDIPREKGEGIEKGYKDLINYWDLKFSEHSESIQHTCEKCGKKLEQNFLYCPYCGEKQR